MTPRTCALDPYGAGRDSRSALTHLELLAEAGRRLSGPLDVNGVLNRASSFIVPGLADWYVLALRQTDAHMRAVAFDPRDPGRRPELGRLAANSLFDEPCDSVMARAGDGTLGWLPAFEVQVADVHTSVCGWTAADFTQLGTGSLVCAPISSGSDTFGAVLLGREESGAYDRYAVQAAAEIVHRLSVLIANASRFEALQEELQQVNEALAVAAHELRTPAAALRGLAQLLLRQYS